MKTIFTKYGSNVPVKIVDFPNKDLTPEIIHNYGIEAVFMYDYKPWLDANGKNIVQNPPRDTRFLLAPLLQVTPTEQDLEDNKEIGIENMVKFFEMAIMPVLNVNHLPIPYYTNAFISKPMVDKQLAQLEEIRKAEAASIKIPEEVLDEWLGDQV